MAIEQDEFDVAAAEEAAETEETTEQAETDETGSTRVVTDEEGNTFLEIGEETDPETDPSDEGQSASTDNQESEATQEGDSDTQTEDSEDFEIPEKFQNAEKEDVVKSYLGLEERLKEQDRKITELSEKAAFEEKSDDEIRQEMTADEYRVTLDDELDRLEEMQESEDVTDEDLQTQRDAVKQARADWERAEMREIRRQELESEENQRFREEHRDTLAEQGIELSDDEYEQVSDLAEEFADKGKLTPEAYHMALVHEYGLPKVQKWMEASAAESERAKMEQARSRETKTVDTNSSGKSTRRVQISGGTPAQIAEQLESLDMAQIDRIIEQGESELLGAS